MLVEVIDEGNWVQGELGMMMILRDLGIDWGLKGDGGRYEGYFFLGGGIRIEGIAC